MYIEKSGIKVIRKNGAIFAPVKVQGVTVMLFLGSGFKEGEATMRSDKHGGSKENNETLLPVTVERLEYLSKWLLLSPSVNTVEAAMGIWKNSYLKSEIETALIISRKMRVRR